MIWRQHIDKVVLRLPDSWLNWNLEMLVFEVRGKPEYPEKTSQSKEENQQQTQPTNGIDAGIWTRATLVGGERSPLRHLLLLQTFRVDFHCQVIFMRVRKIYARKWNVMYRRSHVNEKVMLQETIRNDDF